MALNKPRHLKAPRQKSNSFSGFLPSDHLLETSSQPFKTMLPIWTWKIVLQEFGLCAGHPSFKCSSILAGGRTGSDPQEFQLTYHKCCNNWDYTGSQWFFQGHASSISSFFRSQLVRLLTTSLPLLRSVRSCAVWSDCTKPGVWMCVYTHTHNGINPVVLRVLHVHPLDPSQHDIRCPRIFCLFPSTQTEQKAQECSYSIYSDENHHQGKDGCLLRSPGTCFRTS